jgi:hypothetical protein
MLMQFSVALTVLFGILSVLQAAERAKPQRDAEPVELSIEVRCVTGPEGFAEWKMFDECAWYGKPSYLLQTDDECQKFLELMQCQRRIDIAQMPRTRTRGGDLVTTDNKQLLLLQTVHSESIPNNLFVTPRFEGFIHVGSRLSMRPVYSTDRNAVDMAILCEISQTAGPVKWMPATTGSGIPFFLASPRIEKRILETCSTIPIGGTLMIQTGDIRVDLGPSPTVPRFVSENPYLDRLFKTAFGKEKSRVVLLITPRLANPEDAKVVEGVGEEFLQE